MQQCITGAQVQEAHRYLVQFVEEFEHLYYQRQMDRLHFTQSLLHTILHVAPEISRIGNGVNTSQYTMERMVGELGKSIRQPSNPFANLCQIALQHSQLNALKNICPGLDDDDGLCLPHYSVIVDSDYVFLQPRNHNPQTFSGPILVAIQDNPLCNSEKYKRWGRLRLPNRQISRSLFSESWKKSENI